MPRSKPLPNDPAQLAPKIVKSLIGVDRRTAVTALDIAKLMIPHRPFNHEPLGSGLRRRPGV
jgi:hypothetical protein